ncbi:MAG: GntR family transcriptional regulator [Burkholderiaceae bacterium]
MTADTVSVSRDPLSDLHRQLAQPDRRGVPKYIRLQEALVDAISAGKWKQGERLPTEKALVESTRLSLGTVQRALRGLAGQGLVVRQQGLATFVAGPRREIEDPWHCRFLDESGTKTLPVYPKSVKRQSTRERGPWNDYIGDGRIMRIDRQLDIGGEFTVYSRFYASTELLGYFWECPIGELNGTNFRTLIARECHLPITHITRDLRMMEFAADICAALGKPPPLTGIYLYAIARAGQGRSIYYQEYFIPPTPRFLHFSEGYEAAEHPSI